MLHRKNIVPLIPKNKPLWTRDEAIAFECAREAMNDMVGICSTKIAEEKCNPAPDLRRIEVLHHTRLNFMKERDGVRWYDRDVIAKIRKEYGAKIRAYREGGKCPV